MTSGVPGLQLAYTLVLLAILAGLIHARASLGKFLLSPLAAGVMTLFSGIVIAITSPLLRIFGIGDVEQQTEPFSVRQWVREGRARHAGGPGGVLFIPYTAGEIAALRSVISAWMRLGIFEAMDREEGDQRLWFVIDELDALGEIDGLKDALARVRKFGGRCLLGLQSISQVSGTYGKGTSETIVENCANTCILRCSASERGGTSEFVSKLIGQREVIHTTLSKTRSPCPPAPSATPSAPATPPSPVVPSSTPAEVTPTSATAASREDKPRAGKGRASATSRRPRQPKAAPQPAACYAPAQNPAEGAESKHQLP